ncbi:MAG: hypothetical protein RL115_1306 [Bacteroidota bacterium]
MNGAQIATRLQEVYLSGKWIANTNYLEQINNLNWQQATQKINSLNSIASLVYHIKYYLEGLQIAFTQHQLTISDKFSFDMPSITNEADWQHLKTTFIQQAEVFIELVGKMDEDALAAPFIQEKYGSTWRNIEGVLEHSYYHLGQIVLLKKLLLKE